MYQFIDNWQGISVTIYSEIAKSDHFLKPAIDKLSASLTMAELVAVDTTGNFACFLDLDLCYGKYYLFFFQREDITISFWFLHLHQMSYW